MSDMSLFKNFTITERVKAQFQAEFFNIFNHPVYGNPVNTALIVPAPVLSMVCTAIARCVKCSWASGLCSNRSRQPANKHGGANGSPRFSDTDGHLPPRSEFVLCRGSSPGQTTPGTGP